METIHKAKINAEYVVIPNALAQDNRLSFEARGALVMLLSMPDDWSVNKSWLIKQTKAGRDKVTSIIKELELCGYMSKRTTHDKLGKITGIEWHVYPHDTVERINRRTDEPSYGKTDTTKETSLESKQDTNNGSSTEQPYPSELVEKAFTHFWQCWKETKKSIGKVDTSPKESTFEKKWKPMFNKQYFKSHTVDEFKEEVNRICKFVVDAHSVDGFNRFENMQTGKFFNEKQWRDE